MFVCRYKADGMSTDEIDEIVAKCISCLEMGGLIGTLAAGFISDKVFNGRRTPVIAIFT